MDDQSKTTIRVPAKLLREAHAVMRQCGWQLAPACVDGGDGVLASAAAEVEGAFGDLLQKADLVTNQPICFDVIRRTDGWFVSLAGSVIHASFVRTERELGEEIVSILRRVLP